MTQLLECTKHDLVTPDGRLITFEKTSPITAIGTVLIENIDPEFVGFTIPPHLVFFNIKSALAQLGLDGLNQEIELSKEYGTARIKVEFKAHGEVAKALLDQMPIQAYVGKLFAADDRRRVRDPEYLSRMFGRSDRYGSPLLSLGGLQGSRDLILEKVDGRTIAYLSLLPGCLKYDKQIFQFLPSFAKALVQNQSLRQWVELHQHPDPTLLRETNGDEILLVRTQPLHIRTVFAHVVNEILPEGFRHTSASILQPDTKESGNVYELFGKSENILADIPLEFYTLDPYREHVFFSDRDQLQAALEDPEALFMAFQSAPKPLSIRAATFIVKGTQLLTLTPESWVARETKPQEFPGGLHAERQQLMAERYIEQQPSYPFLERIDEGNITSEGILLTRYFPSPLMKRMLLSNHVQQCLKGIYFQYPSLGGGDFFSSEDRALLNDLEKFGIPVYWVDEVSHSILKYVQKRGRDTGMFVPLDKVETFLKATVLGIYGSNLKAGEFEHELKTLLDGLISLKYQTVHPLLTAKTPLALVTGGGPGAMEIGNKVAKEAGILSCANIIDFRPKNGGVINEQKQNPYVDAKMTYRLDKLVERQAEFHLDLPIFLTGGIGTDFEQALEEVRRKVGATEATPILLFGTPDYWEEKITSRYRCNLREGTIVGSEWISNCFYAVQKAEQGLKVYRDFFHDRLPIGRQHPSNDRGFIIVKETYE